MKRLIVLLTMLLVSGCGGETHCERICSAVDEQRASCQLEPVDCFESFPCKLQPEREVVDIDACTDAIVQADCSSDLSWFFPLIVGDTGCQQAGVSSPTVDIDENYCQ